MLLIESISGSGKIIALAVRVITEMRETETTEHKYERENNFTN